MPLPVMRFVGVALGLAACTPELPPLPLNLELGTGDVAYEPLDDGDEILVIQGPQGGYHLLGSMRVAGIEAGDPDNIQSKRNPTTTFLVDHNGMSLAPHASFTQGLDPLDRDANPGFSHLMLGRFAILDIESDDVLDGEPITFTVTVTDVTGAELTDSRDLIAVPHPLNG